VVVVVVVVVAVVVVVEVVVVVVFYKPYKSQFVFMCVVSLSMFSVAYYAKSLINRTGR